MRKEKLEELKLIIPIIKDTIIDDTVICIWDIDGTVLHCDDAKTFDLHFDVGFVMPNKNDKLFEAMATGKVIHNYIPREVFGVHFEGKIVPVFDGGQVVGCITTAFCVEERKSLEEKVLKMSHLLTDSKESINEILNSAINTADYLKHIFEFIDDLEKKVENVYNVTNDIKSNSSRTKMLALNASIEAARAGDNGKGFKIVANEMGNLSKTSSDSVTKIDQTLNEMVNSINNVTNAISQFDNATLKNSDMVEKIMNDLNTIAE